MKTWWNWRPRERMQRDKRKKSLKNWEIHKAGNGKRLFFPWGGTVSFGAQDQKAECNPLPPCQLWWENKELLYYSVVKNLPATQEFQEMWVQFLGREDPLKEGIIPIPIFGLPWWLRLQCGRPGFDPWARKIPWRRKWQPTPVLLPGKFHGQRSLVGYSPWGRKESDTTEQLHFTSSLHTT